ncbi:hypothetical protein [Corynebacterium sp.]|uniref:hypothetical protein n=1 Tax=Corynebacterium sp. TaxID=1720 RepID=UPI0026DC8A31|nr:hypothetical protein [Corynebacterium sp.]MDO4914464.1 hypothetical protein [Corynebacterium sp.]
MKVIDYVRWMGIAAWTGGLAIPRHSRGLAIKPGSSARHILIESAGGCARTLETIEREYTHIQWLLGGSPLDETALDYVYHQDLRITGGALTNCDFAVVDFSDVPRDYSPEASLVVARQLSTTTAGAVLSEHIPPWNLAEPLGLLALAVREYLTGSTIQELTHAYGRRFTERNSETGRANHTDGTMAFGRLAYSVAHQTGIEPASFFPLITLHVHAEDPVFTERVVERLIDRAQAFATTFGSTVDCRAVFHDVRRHSSCPSTVHEPDAEQTPVIFYRIPVDTGILPDVCFPTFLAEAVASPLSGESQANREHKAVVVHRDPDSGVIEARSFTPGRTLIDRRIRWGDYLRPTEVIGQLQRECSLADPDCLGAHATPTVMWESLATWGLSDDVRAGMSDKSELDAISVDREPHTSSPTTTVRAVHPNVVSLMRDSVDRPLFTVEVDATAPLGNVIHDVCDVLDELGVTPSIDFPVEIVRAGTVCSETPVAAQVRTVTDSAGSGNTAPGNPRRASHSDALPCLWPLALGARSDVVTDQAISLTAVRLALRDCVPLGVSWVGVKHSRIAGPTVQHCITMAIARRDDGAEDAEPDADIQGLIDAVNQICATHFPGLHIACQVVNVTECSNLHQWVTATGYHPVFGLLPAYIQLERLD